MNLLTAVTVTTQTVAECPYESEQSVYYILGVLRGTLAALSAGDPATKAAMCELQRVISAKTGLIWPADQDGGEHSWESEATEARHVSGVGQGFYQCDDGPEYVPDDFDQEELDELFALSFLDAMDAQDIYPR